MQGLPEADCDWSDRDWLTLLEKLVADGILSWREVASLTLGHLNPSQVGTSIASKPSFQKHFPKRKCWQAVRRWHFEQAGKCVDCGTRLELQADHVVPKEIVTAAAKKVLQELEVVSSENVDRARTQVALTLEQLVAETRNPPTVKPELYDALASEVADALADGETDLASLSGTADRLDNIVLRCRRCNVIRRPSHAQGGKTFLTAEAGLMWLLLVKQPANYDDFAKICRRYGMSMASIRFEEAWAMARWLNRIGKYVIDATSKYAPDGGGDESATE
ncbi:MAG: hypothetical protein IPM29_32555 [Planctomycetes bacterium]|nr:hypothetical protein [Planctomycetota bacterium]